jgi:hypothetical protein
MLLPEHGFVLLFEGLMRWIVGGQAAQGAQLRLIAELRPQPPPAPA